MGKQNAKKGSVLIMMALIMVVASIYITTALFDVRGTVDQERLYKTKKQMSYLHTAIADYRTNNGGVALTALDDLVSRGTQVSCNISYNGTFTTMQLPTGWCGPYIDKSLFLGTATAFREDAWGTGFTISSVVADGIYTYTLRSCGEDLTCGNADDITITF